MKGYAPRPPEISVWLAGLGLAAVTSVIAVACTLDPRATGPAGTGGATTSVGIGGDEGGDNIGGGGAGAGGAEPEELEAWKAEAQSPMDGAYQLPPWLVLKSPSENKTVQVGPHELKTGIGADVARARNMGDGWGLTLERERTNRVLHSQIAAPHWSLSPLTTILPTTGPDGEESAARVDELNSGAIGATFSAIEPGPPNGDATLSVWLSGVPDDRQVFIGASMLDPRGLTRHATEWAPVSTTGKEGIDPTSNPRAQLYPAYGEARNTGAANFAFVSFETGKYPSSPIVTSGMPVTRSAESLAVLSTRVRELIPDGRFHVKLVFAPHYAKGEQETDHDLFFVDDTHRVYLSAATSEVVVAEGEAADSTEGLGWAREEPITVEVVRTAAALRVRVTKAAADAPEMLAQVPASAFEIPGDIHILGNATGCQEGADLKSITFFKPE